MGLPGSTSALRFPTVDAPRTSVCNIKQVLTLSSPTGTPAPSWNTGDLVVAFFGQPGRLFTYWGNYVPGGQIFQFASVTGVAIEVWTVGSEAGSYWPVTGLVAATSTPTGSCKNIGVANGVGYIFMNVGDTVAVLTGIVDDPTAVGVVTVDTYRFSDGNSEPVYVSSYPVPFSSGTTAPSSVISTPGEAGYYAFYISSITTSNPTALIQFTSVVLETGNPVGWIHVTSSDIDPRTGGDEQLVRDFRVNAASLLMSNTTASINKQGSVVAARVRTVSDFANLAPETLGRCAEKYNGVAEHGVYTFKEFSDYQQNFRSATASGYPVFHLDTDDYYHFIQISCPNVSTMSNMYTVSVDMMLEFKSDSSRYAKGVCNMGYTDLIAARALINSNPEWFYENPLHAADIYRFIRSGIGAAARFGKAHAVPLAALASSVNPGNAALYATLSQLMSRL